MEEFDRIRITRLGSEEILILRTNGQGRYWADFDFQQHMHLPRFLRSYNPTIHPYQREPTETEECARRIFRLRAIAWIQQYGYEIVKELSV